MKRNNRSPAASSESLRIGVYQGPTQPGALDANAEEALRLLAEAHRSGVHFACLPESFLSGYGRPDVLRSAAVSVRERWFKHWLARCNFGDMVCIVGFTEKRGTRYYNSAAVIQRRKLLGVYSKAFSGSDYENATFTFATKFPVFKAHGIVFGVIICADSSQIEPSMLLAAQGARLIFSPHYNYIPMPHTDAHMRSVRNCHVARAVENDCWIARANSITAPMQKMGDHEGFGYGDSFILDNHGEPRAEAGFFTTEWITADAPRSELSRSRRSRVEGIPRKIREQVARLYLKK